MSTRRFNVCERILANGLLFFCLNGLVVGAFAQVQPAAPLAGQPSQAEPRGSAASCASCHQPAPDNRPAPLPGEALDEPRGGKTLGGTPVTQRIAECFPAEARDLFWQMDMVPDESQPGHPLRPLNFEQNGDGVIDDHERDAIRGRNTWVLWCAGNEGFWNWLSQNGYGITDFLILVDSRNRTNRFVQAVLLGSVDGHAKSGDLFGPGGVGCRRSFAHLRRARLRLQQPSLLGRGGSPQLLPGR